MTLAAVSLLGIVLFAWPFLGLGFPADTAALSAAVGAVAALALVEAGSRRLDSGRLALLAALAAIEAGLRLALVNGIGGFSPVFFVILVAGYTFGPSFGFLVGAFGVLVSAIATGGVGPWLPYQMFGAGWMGVAAGVAGVVVTSATSRRASSRTNQRAASFTNSRSWMPAPLDLAALVAVAVVTGFAYGALTDSWEWVAFYRDVPSIGWSATLGPADAIANFTRFYLATSLAWDTFRAAGDALAVLAFGAPVLMALRRLNARIGFEVVDRSSLDVPTRL